MFDDPQGYKINIFNINKIWMSTKLSIFTENLYQQFFECIKWKTKIIIDFNKYWILEFFPIILNWF